MKKNKKNTEFSKKLLIQESILIWITTLTFLVLAVFCILRDYIGELPWLTAMIAFPWAAYGVSQAWYYKKSLGENTKDGITFENMLQEWKARQSAASAEFDESAEESDE